MKPAPFDYVRPGNLKEASALLLAGDGNAKLVAGGQSLGPDVESSSGSAEHADRYRRSAGVVRKSAKTAQNSGSAHA